MVNTVVWFEIPVIDLDRAVKFYTDVMEVEFHFVEDEKSKMAFFPFSRIQPQVLWFFLMVMSQAIVAGL